MDGYSWIALLTLIVTVVAAWMIRKRKEYKYSTLDISGIILNTVLIVMIYPRYQWQARFLKLVDLPQNRYRSFWRAQPLQWAG